MPKCSLLVFSVFLFLFLFVFFLLSFIAERSVCVQCILISCDLEGHKAPTSATDTRWDAATFFIYLQETHKFASHYTYGKGW